MCVQECVLARRPGQRRSLETVTKIDLRCVTGTVSGEGGVKMVLCKRVRVCVCMC